MSAGSVECPTISGAIAYDHTIIGKVYMLVYRQAIHCPKLKNHLMCPMQSQMAGAEDPDEKTHAIIVNGLLNPNELLIIPLVLKVVNSYLPSRKPREINYEDESILHIDMKSEALVWEPYETDFSEQEYAMTDFRGEVIRS